MRDASSHPPATILVPAARYPRLVHTVRGDVPTIRTVGILTAALPGSGLGEAGWVTQNIRRNADLGDDLATYSTRQIEGRFGALVNPYVVSNLPRARLVALGVKYGQDGVIFGCRRRGKQLGFEWICTNAKRGTVGNVQATRAMLLEPQQPVRPGEPTRAAGGDGDCVSLRVKGARFVLPFFDEAEETGWRGGTVLSYRREDVPDTSEARAAMTAVLQAEALLRKAERKKEPTPCLYTQRGALNDRLRDLHRVMGNWRGYPLRWERTW